jgi:hypothetical protein
LTVLAPAPAVRDPGWRLAELVTLGVLGPLLCAFVPAYLWSLTAPRAAGHDLAADLAVATTVVAGAQFARLTARAPQRLFELIFWVFSYVFFGLAPLVQVRVGTVPPTTPRIDDSLQATALGVVLAALVAFSLGAPCGRALVRRDARPHLVGARRLTLLTLGSLAATSYYLASVGVAPLFQSREGRAAIEAGLWGDPAVAAVVKSISTYPLIVCFVGSALLRRAGRRPLHLALLQALTAVAILVVANPVSAPRYVSGTALLACLLSLVDLRRVRWSRGFSLVLIVGLVGVFPYADALRRGTGNPDYEVLGPLELLTSADFDSYAQVVNALTHVRVEGVETGRQFLGALLFWVPRAVWASKPQDTGIVLALDQGYEVTNLSAPYVAEFLVNGGLAGAVLGSLLLGVLVGWLDAGQSAAPHRSPSVAGLVFPFYFMILLRGSLLQAMAGLFILLATTLFVRAEETGPHRSG